MRAVSEERTQQPSSISSLRAKRSNPESFRGGILDCFVARAPRNDSGACAPTQTPPTPSPTRRNPPQNDRRP
ncbi:hypothetical protein CWO91_21575 [Bradyrhizobium genosp. SA-3]|uniref:Uncharacterized protein n=1 Tax=Bradyrhizobium zhanjiangense TaxID=1325107 RepID=A0A4Q0QUC4_9BRAD|nr:hypothetical protein EAS62_22385 [Bradyrhizobium zhanjiangense]RXH00677.1 hypothetical protein EAS61_09890 [Bradyrhizobium zhanjiangense]RZN08646.1 hypothetical protein CWO91_21575 [Bradyrhizobium genosp. SA-3]